MNREELMQIVREIIGQEAKVNTDQIEPDVELTNLDIDSLDILKIAVALEKSFNITITTAELERIKTFGDVIEGLERKIDVRGQQSPTNLLSPTATNTI